MLASTQVRFEPDPLITISAGGFRKRRIQRPDRRPNSITRSTGSDTSCTKDGNHRRRLHRLHLTQPATEGFNRAGLGASAMADAEIGPGALLVRLQAGNQQREPCGRPGETLDIEPDKFKLPKGTSEANQSNGAWSGSFGTRPSQPVSP